jgi:hypothetical protein
MLVVWVGIFIGYKLTFFYKFLASCPNTSSRARAIIIIVIIVIII